MKQKVIIFEGVDKSGKTTLKEMFNKETNYKYWVLDRSAISSIVYDKMFNRNNEDYWSLLLSSLTSTFDVRIIFCIADIKDIQSRLLYHNEQLPSQLKDIRYIQSYFRETLNKYNINYITINTSLSKDECLTKIRSFVEG